MSGHFRAIKPLGQWLGTVLGFRESRDRRGWLKLLGLLALCGLVVAYFWWYQPYQGAQRMQELFVSRVQPEGQGLSTAFFTHLDQAGAPNMLAPATTWDFPGLERFPGGGRDHFVLRWLGVIYIDQSGRYGMGGLVDDGLIILIDGKPVVHEWYQSATHEVWGSVYLSEGPHAIEIRYLQLAGEAALKLQWQPPGKNREPLPFKAMRPLKEPLPLGDIARLRLNHNMLKLEPSTYKPFTGGRFWRLPW